MPKQLGLDCGIKGVFPYLMLSFSFCLALPREQALYHVCTATLIRARERACEIEREQERRVCLEKRAPLFAQAENSRGGLARERETDRQ